MCVACLANASEKKYVKLNLTVKNNSTVKTKQRRKYKPTNFQ